MNKKISNIMFILIFSFLLIFSEIARFDYQQIIALSFIAVLLLLDYVKKLYLLAPLILIASAVPLLFEQTRQVFMLVYLPVIWLLLANKIITEHKDQYYPLLISVLAVVLSLAVNAYYITQNTWSLFSYKTVLNRVTILLICFVIIGIIEWVKRKKAKEDKRYNLWPLFIVYLLTLILQVPVSSFYSAYQVGIYLLLPPVVFIAVCLQPGVKLKKLFAR